MADDIRASFRSELEMRFHPVTRLAGSRSLYDISCAAARLYVRYSKVHQRGRTFYGLRAGDLRRLEGRDSFLCFLWDGQRLPLLVPFSEYEDVFRATAPAPDGQYKVQVYLLSTGTELYIAGAGRFNVDRHFGWDKLDRHALKSSERESPELGHSQVQTLLGAIGWAKGFGVWVPHQDRGALDWSLVSPFECFPDIPSGLASAREVVQHVDVVWFGRGSAQLGALFEVEHSTPIYSGLLRLNDVHLLFPGARPRFGIVANAARRDGFARQINRVTFRSSGLTNLCSFFEYTDVYGWYERTAGDQEAKHR